MPADALDHLGERPVRDALAVRKAATDEHRRALDRVEELARETGLADARLAVDREEVRALVAQRAGEGVLEQLQLGVPTDQRRVGRTLDRRSVRRERGPGPDRLLAAANVDRADVVDVDPPDREAVRGRADQDLARLGDLLQAGREVDRLAGGEGRVAGVGHDLAGLDADPRLELELVDRVEDPERSPHGALGVVLVRLRDAEGSHDRIARELLDLPAVSLDASRDTCRRTASRGGARPRDRSQRRATSNRRGRRTGPLRVCVPWV